MVRAAEITLWVSLLLVAHTYLLYPVLLKLLVRAFGRPVRSDPSYTPTVAFLVPAYNEERVILAKLRNVFGLDYPPERVSVWVGSDRSTDATNGIVREFSKHDRRVQLWVSPRRCGKTGILNELAPRIDAEVIVFTDANTMHEPDSLRRMVCSFADPAVGAVAGQINHAVRTTHMREERLYRSFEVDQKRNEALFHSVIGAFGGFYAIRSRLFRPIPPNAYSNDDVLIPMSIVRQGYRVWYEPQAVSTEESTEDLRQEFRRRLRIGAGNYQSLAWLADFLVPLRGRVWFCYFSHKVLRWLSPALLLLAFAALVMLTVLTGLPVYQFATGVVLGGLVAAAASPLAPLPLFTHLFYFLVMNAALLIGLGRFLTGIRSAAWNRTARG